MRRLTVTSLYGLFAIAAGSSAGAQEVPPDPGLIKVYRVADLVARQSVRETTLLKSVTANQWSGEHPRTIASLTSLAKLIETIVPSESGAVAVHDDSLSLVVRYTAAGHEQIAELLEQLRAQQRPVVELTLIPVIGLEGDNQSLTGEQSGRLEELLVKRDLSPAETQEVVKMLESNPDSDNQLSQPLRIELVNGRKTPFGRWMIPMSATAVMTKDAGEFLIRIDNVADDIDSSGNMPVQTQSFSIPDRHSALIATYCDGSGLYWLAVPKRIEPQRKVTAAPPTAAE